MNRLIRAGGLVVLAGALWTGARHGRFFTDMTGFLPPHYGYSGYWISALILLTPSRLVRWTGVLALLASGNRASQVGAIAGWAWRGGRRRALLAGILGLLAVVGGYAMKPRTDNDSIRIKIWRAAWKTAKENPAGVGVGGFEVGVDGYGVTKAHSDVLQLAVEQGFKTAAVVLLLAAWAFYRLPESPAKAVVFALTAQSIIDNRLHYPACAALYALAWLSAALELRAPRPRKTP